MKIIVHHAADGSIHGFVVQRSDSKMRMEMALPPGVVATEVHGLHLAEGKEGAAQLRRLANEQKVSGSPWTPTAVAS